MDIAYPRPQLVRHEWLSLEGLWQYSFSNVRTIKDVAWQGQILVPFPPESPMSGLGDASFHAVIWYQRKFRIPDNWQGRKLLLHFGAVDYCAQVWVNGVLVAEHEGGHTPFYAEISKVLVPGDQEIVVRVEDDPTDLEQPRGKQDWELEPHAIWYPRTTGIWQPVWLEPLPDVAVASIRITPDVDRFAIEMEVALDVPMLSGFDVRGRLTLDDQVLSITTMPVEKSRAAGVLVLPPPQSEAARRALLWSPENPILFDLEVELIRDGQVLDRVASYAGLRSVAATNGSFYLNDEPYFLQMVLDQGYWPDSHLAAPSPDALRRDVELTRAMGFNGVRKHQKIEDPRYLYWADRLGLLVWDELPGAYVYSSRTAHRLTRELEAMIERDYNHPCVVAWVPLNESWGIPEVVSSPRQEHFAKALYHLAKALDPTRPVVDNDGWEHVDGDLFTIHDYENNADVYATRYGSSEGMQEALAKEYAGHRLTADGFDWRGLPVILSEFGGIRLGSGAGWGYSQVDSPKKLLNRIVPLFLSAHAPMLSGFCYTQFADTFQEQNGLLYADRTPKVPLESIARALQEGLRKRAQDGLPGLPPVRRERDSLLPLPPQSN